MFLLSDFNFYADPKFKMAALVSDSLTYKKMIIIRTFCLTFSLGFKNNTFCLRGILMYSH